jgi:hypothetical protein
LALLRGALPANMAQLRRFWGPGVARQGGTLPAEGVVSDHVELGWKSVIELTWQSARISARRTQSARPD